MSIELVPTDHLVAELRKAILAIESKIAAFAGTKPAKARGTVYAVAA
jgi:hypothetical protein